MIALDAHGEVTLEFDTPGMYRGWIGPDGEARIDIFRDDS